jgi:ABC-type transport system involved in multi-copper enzyme maturation permease subunit
MIAMLRYEWRRITTLRSTWILGSAFLLVTMGFAYLGAFVLPSATLEGPEGSRESLKQSLSSIVTTGTNLVSAVFLLTIAAAVFGHEYRYGLIRLTLTEFPRRAPVFVGKTAMLLAWMTALFLVSAGLCWLLALLAGDSVNGEATGEVMSAVGRSLLFVLGVALIGFAITALTRNLALGVVVPLVWGAVLESLLSALLSTKTPWLVDALPFRNGLELAAGENLPHSWLVFGAWVVALVAAAWLAFERRDA